MVPLLLESSLPFTPNNDFLSPKTKKIIRVFLLSQRNGGGNEGAI